MVSSQLPDAATTPTLFARGVTGVAGVGSKPAEISRQPHLPVLIIPGFMSSGLQVEKSQLQPSWENERLWLNLASLGLQALLSGKAGNLADTAGTRTAQATARTVEATTKTVQALKTVAEGVAAGVEVAAGNVVIPPTQHRQRQQQAREQQEEGPMPQEDGGGGVNDSILDSFITAPTGSADMEEGVEGANLNVAVGNSEDDCDDDARHKMSVKQGASGPTPPPRDKSEDDLETGGQQQQPSSSEQQQQQQQEKRKNMWLRHMALSPHDLTSEYPDVQVRPLQGLAGVDYLTPGVFTDHVSYVFGPLIRALQNVGYVENLNLAASPYDWRVSPSELQRRDDYFRKTMVLVEELYDKNGGTPVVLVCHSMGCKVGHYFLNYANAYHASNNDHKSDENGYGEGDGNNDCSSWTAKYVHTYMPIGGPHLGAPKALRGSVTGDKMGLDAFLSDDEARTLGRSFGSSLWLVPPSIPPLCPSVVYRRNEGGFVVKVPKQVVHVESLLGGREMNDRPKKLKLMVKFGKRVVFTDFVDVTEVEEEFQGVRRRREPGRQRQRRKVMTVELGGKFTFATGPTGPHDGIRKRCCACCCPCCLLTCCCCSYKQGLVLSLHEPGVQQARRRQGRQQRQKQRRKRARSRFGAGGGAEQEDDSRGSSADENGGDNVGNDTEGEGKKCDCPTWVKVVSLYYVIKYVLLLAYYVLYASVFLLYFLAYKMWLHLSDGISRVTGGSSILGAGKVEVSWDDVVDSRDVGLQTQVELVHKGCSLCCARGIGHSAGEGNEDCSQLPVVRLHLRWIPPNEVSKMGDGPHNPRGKNDSGGKDRLQITECPCPSDQRSIGGKIVSGKKYNNSNNSRDNHVDEKRIISTSGYDLLHKEGNMAAIRAISRLYDDDVYDPRGRGSSTDPPSVKRVKAVYGINLPTEVGAVYKRWKTVSERVRRDGGCGVDGLKEAGGTGDGSGLDIDGDGGFDDDGATNLYCLDRKARIKPPTKGEKKQSATTPSETTTDTSTSSTTVLNNGYTLENGILKETKSTPQRIDGPTKFRSSSIAAPFQRCSGDGTVPYWSLQHVKTWQGKEGLSVSVTELDRAEHREILADARLHKILIDYVTTTTRTTTAATTTMAAAATAASPANVDNAPPPQLVTGAAEGEQKA